MVVISMVNIGYWDYQPARNWGGHHFVPHLVNYFVCCNYGTITLPSWEKPCNKKHKHHQHIYINSVKDNGHQYINGFPQCQKSQQCHEHFQKGLHRRQADLWGLQFHPDWKLQK